MLYSITRSWVIGWEWFQNVIPESSSFISLLENKLVGTPDKLLLCSNAPLFLNTVSLHLSRTWKYSYFRTLYFRISATYTDMQLSSFWEMLFCRSIPPRCPNMKLLPRDDYRSLAWHLEGWNSLYGSVQRWQLIHNVRSTQMNVLCLILLSLKLEFINKLLALEVLRANYLLDGSNDVLVSFRGLK